MAERVVLVVQARLGSQRLPGKCLRPLSGKTLIRHVLDRACAVADVDAVILATSTSEHDDLLEVEAKIAGVQVVRGSEWDVLARVQKAALQEMADAVVRITGDCPLLDPVVVRLVMEAWRTKPVDYASNDTTCSGYPDGTDAEVMSYLALDWAAARAVNRYDREHVTPFLRRHGRCATVVSSVDYSAVKLSVDTVEDFERVAQIMARLPMGQYALHATMQAAFAAGVWKGTS